MYPMNQNPYSMLRSLDWYLYLSSSPQLRDAVGGWPTSRKSMDWSSSGFHLNRNGDVSNGMPNKSGVKTSPSVA
jgi:hypothetical protein